jgi:hypothetical protein
VLVAIEGAVQVGDALVRKAAAAALLGFGVNAESAIKTLRLDKLPTTDSGKVRRRELARLYAERHPGAGHDAKPRPSDRSAPGLAARLLPLIGSLRKPRTVRALFERVFPGRTVADGDTFVALGGDSLSFVEVSIALEEILGDLPRDWQNRTISELERARAPRALLHDVDTTLLLRFVCIVSIVTGHFTELPIGGATFMLLTVAGYNFSRFQLPSVLGASSVAPILWSAARIAIPLLLVIAAIEVKHGDFDLASLALLNNWHDARDADIDFWFVELLTQVLLFMAVLLAIPALRDSIRRNTFLFALVLLVAALGAAVLGPLAWSTTHLYDRVPHMLLWLFALGMLVENARTAAMKAAVAALIVATPLIVWNRGELPFWIAHGREWVWVGGVLLLYVERIPVPYPVNKLAYWVGGASMFIYILHWSVRSAWQGIAPVQSVFLEITVAILAGIAAWWIWDFGTRMLVRVYTNWREAGLSRASGSSRGGGVTFPPTSP